MKFTSIIGTLTCLVYRCLHAWPFRHNMDLSSSALGFSTTLSSLSCVY
ncbi:Long chain base biosynthesis protein 1 [Zea mays]|uniref:Long chain base biosynthesis protein 1 n=1 Tax=Zea mays TaxID=4577 RepID=A0A1D6PER0_MAIZE|nr:Long chain base biosynthesis protein 1 [Zea mays]